MVDKDGTIVTGHTRYKACLKLGYTEIPCVIADELTPEQINEFRIVDNKVGELSTWDKKKLNIEMAKLPKFNPLQFGFKPKDIILRKDSVGGYGDERNRTNNAYNLSLYNAKRTAGKYQMPTIKGTNYTPKELLGFNYAKSTEPKDACIHFFLDDYQFERVWNSPEQYITVLDKFTAVLTPDFSLYSDMPLAMQMWNTYRNRLIGQYWQSVGLKVIPTVSWSVPASYDFCFDGLPKNSTLAVSTIGVKTQTENFKLWKKGMDEMIQRLVPKRILVYGGELNYNYKGIPVVYYENAVTERMANKT